jgi:predicted MFS family arabinose efflux permease
MRVLRILTAAVPFGWIFIQSPLVGVLNHVVAGAVWSGHELAAFNGLLSVTPEEGRARFIAINALAVSICAALGPVLGGLLSELIGYQPLFGLSAALRVAAGILFIVLVRDWNKK